MKPKRVPTIFTETAQRTNKLHHDTGLRYYLPSRLAPSVTLKCVSEEKAHYTFISELYFFHCYNLKFYWTKICESTRIEHSLQI
jgi:hypothetical protein